MRISRTKKFLATGAVAAVAVAGAAFAAGTALASTSPASVSVTAISTTSITVSVPASEQVQVYTQATSHQVYRAEVSAGLHSVTGLAAGTAYEVRAANSAGWSAPELVITQAAPGATGASGASGTNGLGVKSATVNGAGDLVITYSDGTTQDAGHVVGGTGASGAPGASAVTNITAETSIKNWPDTGGAGDVWGNDNWTRTLNVTVEDQVNTSHCNGAPACYAVFGTISDTGTTTPVDGAKAPNNSIGGTITAANITQITSQGTAAFQFYATSDAINAKNVPLNDDAATQGKLASTTDWGQLAFPAGTQFFGDELTAYDWSYSAAESYTSGGTAVSCNQAWNDQVNPGDDGQGASDGNITGTCPVS